MQHKIGQVAWQCEIRESIEIKCNLLLAIAWNEERGQLACITQHKIS